MKTKVVYVERKPGPFVSIEKVFRAIAANLPDSFDLEFQSLAFGWRVWDVVRNLLFFRPKGADIYHVTGHVHYIVSRLPPERTILSIMDVRFVVLNRGFRRWVLKKLYLDWPLRRARYITTISNKVKEEIIELTGCDPSKIRVLKLPLLSHIEPRTGKHFNDSKPSILQIGTMSNKNLVLLAEALVGLECRLIIVGELDAKQRHALGKCKIEYENYFGVSDERIRELYESSDIVTFCSTYEGFGLPIIEAQAMRKPLVTSDIEPLRSVAGEGACLADPFSAESIRRAVVSLIDDPNRRRMVVEAGVANVKRFDPQAVAMQYAALYEEIMESFR
jgi:glycosyltransferase involved in cell wall biosynthesis